MKRPLSSLHRSPAVAGTIRRGLNPMARTRVHGRKLVDAPLLSRGLLVALALLIGASARTESHRATRLGNPATRFAPPLSTPEELRALFRNEKLRPDFAAVLKQWGWPGNLEDLFSAAATAPVQETEIPVGTTMPFMSSRDGGRPVCLRNVLWAGGAAAPGYAFHFNSAGHRYRCVTPKACSNFFLEDLGPEPRPMLALDCAAPAEAPAGVPLTVCLTVGQIGNVAEPGTTVTLSFPENAAVQGVTGGGAAAPGRVSWEIRDLAPAAVARVCATLVAAQPGALAFTATASSGRAEPASASCATKVFGIPAILLEVVDLEDPIEVGKEVTYDVRVFNQGTATGTNIRLACVLPASQTFFSGSGTTTVQTQDGAVTMAVLPELAPKAAASWRIAVKAAQAGDARFKVELSSDQFQRPIVEEESTQQY
jgi:uncharacterized repeat protein (TIGR01451 family)